jgi:hypothetical protein
MSLKYITYEKVHFVFNIILPQTLVIIINSNTPRDFVTIDKKREKIGVKLPINTG